MCDFASDREKDIMVFLTGIAIWFVLEFVALALDSHVLGWGSYLIAGIYIGLKCGWFTYNRQNYALPWFLVPFGVIVLFGAFIVLCIMLGAIFTIQKAKTGFKPALKAVFRELRRNFLLYLGVVCALAGYGVMAWFSETVTTDNLLGLLAGFALIAVGSALAIGSRI